MIKNGLLPTLWQVLESFPQETTLKTLAVEIIANISQFVQHHVHIFQSGQLHSINTNLKYIRNAPLKSKFFQDNSKLPY